MSSGTGRDNPPQQDLLREEVEELRATKGRWSKGRPPKDSVPLTDEVFVSHLRGEETIGIYPLLRGDNLCVAGV